MIFKYMFDDIKVYVLQMLLVKKFIRLLNVNSNIMGICYIFEFFFIGFVFGMKGK